MFDTRQELFWYNKANKKKSYIYYSHLVESNIIAGTSFTVGTTVNVIFFVIVAATTTTANAATSTTATDTWTVAATTS